MTRLKIASLVALTATFAFFGLAIKRNDTQTAEPSRKYVKLSALAHTKPSIFEGGPLGRALEEYAKRAYPADEIPFELTRRATEAWQAFESTAPIGSDGLPGAPLLNWSLFGPSIATVPSVLSFSGAPYITSGRVTALAIDPVCNSATCRVWVAAAGGGIWRTNNVLDAQPTWTFVSGSFVTNAIGRLVYDASRNTLYAGTGEPNSSADSAAGLGIYKSTDGGNTWTKLAAQASVPAGTGVDCTAVVGSGGARTAPAYTGPAFDGRGIGGIVIDPTNANIMYVGTTRATRGVTSVSGGGVTISPGLPPLGVWKSTDGGATFTLLNAQDVCLNPNTPGDAGIVQSSFGSSRGVHLLAMDPNSPSTIYAAPYPQNNAQPINTKGGVWRTTDSGATWAQIKNARNPAANTDRASFAVAQLPGGKTRMYVGVGNTATTTAGAAHVYRTDDAATATDANFIDLSAQQDASAAPNQTTNYCTGQCWYDNIVYTPPGKPDVVYVGGSYDYAQYGNRNNGRAFLRSSDAGVTFTDMTWDATVPPTPAGDCCQPNPYAPNGMHPDSHAVVEVPGTDRAIFGSDGGVVLSSGAFADVSAQCTTRTTPDGLPLTSNTTDLATCQQLLKAVPTLLTSINAGLSTLQFQSLVVAPDDNTHLQGGTQDNGTWEGYNSQNWPQVIYGDGGQSGFSSANSTLRFNTFTGKGHSVNFRNGDPTKWSYIGGGALFASMETALFYPPIIADPNPAAGMTIFQGSQSVWRTQDWGGPQGALETNCNVFTLTVAALPTCGDLVPIGPGGNTNLTASAASPDYRGTTRSGGNVGFIARTPADTSTMWVATTTGRLFVSKNADAPAAAVTYTRIDSLDAKSPNRFISGIVIDAANPNRAWVSYSSYNTLTPTTPGHIFLVTFTPGATPTATWTNLDGSGATAFPDMPATSIAVSKTGDVYASTDFGVSRLPNGSTNWEVAGTGLPMVEVAGLTISGDGRKLYAATHGRSAWVADLPQTAPVTPTLTTQASAGVTIGGSIRDTATLAGSAGATGTITFRLYGPDDATCSGTAVFTSTVPVFDNGSYDSATYTPTAAGTYRWIASYSGDANNNNVSGACNDPNENVTVSPAATATPTPTATATPTATPTPQPSATVTPVPTATATPSASPTATATPSPSATATASPSPSASPTPAPPAQAQNLSTRLAVGTGENQGIAGLIIRGSGSKKVIIRAIGPTLAQEGVQGVLEDPVLELRGPDGSLLFTNDNWRQDQEQEVKDSGIPPRDDRESAIVATLEPNNYTAIISGKNGSTGVGLIEIYDLDSDGASRLANLSTRGAVGTSDSVIIAGFILGNNEGNADLIVRGIGPSLAARGVANTLQDPTLELRDRDGAVVFSNDNWQDNEAQAATISSRGLAPTDERESGIAASLAPAAYTAILAGRNGSTGVGSVEIYVTEQP